jgi:hypothetical protein
VGETAATTGLAGTLLTERLVNGGSDMVVRRETRGERGGGGE